MSFLGAERKGQPRFKMDCSLSHQQGFHNNYSWLQSLHVLNNSLHDLQQFVLALDSLRSLLPPLAQRLVVQKLVQFLGELFLAEIHEVHLETEACFGNPLSIVDLIA